MLPEIIQVTVQTIITFNHFHGVQEHCGHIRQVSTVSLSYGGLILGVFSQRFSGSFSERLIFMGLFPYPIHHAGRYAKFPGCY